MRADADTTGEGVGVIVGPADDVGPDARDAGARQSKNLAKADRPQGRPRERVPRQPAGGDVPEERGPVAERFIEPATHGGGQSIRVLATTEFDDVAKPPDEIRARGDLAAHAGEIEVRV